MRPKLFAAAFVLSVIQWLCFIAIWSAAISRAQASGRAQRSDIGYGILITYGLILIGFLFLLSSGIGTISGKAFHRWFSVLGCLAIWSYWMIPSFSAYPFRGPVYYSTGCVILAFGTMIAAPLLHRKFTATP